jgi:hypothetical protein
MAAIDSNWFRRLKVQNITGQNSTEQNMAHQVMAHQVTARHYTAWQNTKSLGICFRSPSFCLPICRFALRAYSHQFLTRVPSVTATLAFQGWNFHVLIGITCE